MQAILRIPRGAPVDDVSVEAILAMLDDAGVVIDHTSRGKVEAAIAEHQTGSADLTVTVAEGVPPQRGADGRISWLAEFGPTGRVDRAPPPTSQVEDADDPVDYYELSPFVLVEAGEAIATVIDPEPGFPGVDVYGNAIEAEPGQPAAFRCDDTVSLDEDGRLVAARSGLPCLCDGTVRISCMLDLNEPVSFATGNIRFDGTVIARQGVRDRFLVEATGDVVVGGLIEAARVVCGGNLEASGGIVGREVGTIDVAGDASARYLDAVDGRVAGNLAVHRELINCNLTVEQSLDLAQGAIIGGRLTVHGAVRASILGSSGGVPTELRLGLVPELTDLLNRITETMRRIDERLRTLREQILPSGSRAVTDSGCRRRLAARATELVNTRRGLSEQFRRLKARFDAQCHVEVRVTRTVHPGVTLVLPLTAIRFVEPVTGPITLSRGEDARLEIDHPSGERFNLLDVAQITPLGVW